jgi:ABC-2 type transport system ATP-binding protein
LALRAPAARQYGIVHPVSAHPPDTSPSPPQEAPGHAASEASGRTVLSVAGLRKVYATVTAVDDVSFDVRRREVVGLLGPNGAGKTTTLNMILGVLSPTAGSVRIGDFDLARQRARALAQANFSAVYASLPGNLTVAQNLRFFGLVYGIPELGRRVGELLRQFDLDRLRDTKCGLLSSGEQTRVALAKAVLNRPRLLLLDEPTASLDPAAAQTIRARIRSLALETGCGILWTSHNMYEVEEVCDRVLFLSHGRILLEGDPRRLPREHGASTLEELFIRLAREPLIEPMARAG